MDRAFVRGAGDKLVFNVNRDVGDDCLVSASSQLGHLITSFGVINSQESSFLGGSDQNLSILTQLNHSQRTIMSLDFDGLFLGFEVNHLDVACLFIGDSQDTGALLHGQTYEAEWVLTGDETVGQVEVLEVVDVDLVLQYNHHSEIARSD